MRRIWNVPVAPGPRPPSAFTLIEVLVIIFIVGLLVMFAIPMRDRPDRSPARACLNNTKQLTLGWMLYAGDYQDALVANQSYTRAAPAPASNWMAGVMDWSAHPDNTNTSLLVKPEAMAMAAYIKAPGTYLCPGDKSESAAGPRVRSYGLNGFLGAYGSGPAYPGWKQQLKLTELPSPATTLVFVEEHADSIDDGCFVNDPNRTSSWFNLPSGRHNGAGSFSFADGHSEIHKWVNGSTLAAEVRNGPKPPPAVRATEDLTWVLERTTRRDSNDPPAVREGQNVPE
jgi:prepilin-type processing-associated H-X9-DG protein